MADDEGLLLLLVIIDEATELEEDWGATLLELSTLLEVVVTMLLELSSASVVLGVVILELLGACGVLTQPLNIKAKAAMIMGILLLFFISNSLYTHEGNKKRLPIQ